MLWTDSDFVTPEELASIDSEILSVANAEEIVLENPNGTGLIHRAIEECGAGFMKYMQLFGGYLYAGDSTSGHDNAVMNIGQGIRNRSRILLSQVPVSSIHPLAWAPVKRWVVYWILYLFYQDAASRRMDNDRYGKKADYYKAQANGKYWDDLRTAGVPVVNSPLPCPGAIWEPGQGVWDDGAVTVVSGSGTLTDTYAVVITWVDQIRQKNAESGPSAQVVVSLTPGNVLKVDTSLLVPPTGQQHPGTLALATVDCARATGWNVYAGPAGGPLYLQNPSPIAVATKTWTAPADPVTGTVQAGTGQWADRYLSMPSGVMIQRG